MSVKKIKHSDIIRLGFDVQVCGDKVWEDTHGYPYKIITYDLTKKIQLQWHQDTRVVGITRIDNQSEENIVKRAVIPSLEALESIIYFFKD